MTATDENVITCVRTFEVDLDVERGADGNGRTINAQAVPYNVVVPIPSEGIRESFAPGAFTHQMAAMHRVVATYRHQSQGGEVIGRLANAYDVATGLRVAMAISDTQRGNDTLTLVRDRAITQVSVGFRAQRQHSRVTSDGVTQRTRASLFEVALVPEGAYGRNASVIGVRSMDAMFALDDDTNGLDEDEIHGLDLVAARALVDSIPLLSTRALT